jgi:hypothetical protein
MIVYTPDNLLFRVASKFRKNETQMRMRGICTDLVSLELEYRTETNSRIVSQGAVEIAFDDDDGHIVVEVITAKICRGVVDASHKAIGRQ